MVLVHGFKDTARKLEPMARYLRRRGWTASTITLKPSWGQAGIDELAAQLDEFVHATFAPHEKADLVGFSMGGLVCRYYLQRLGGIERVDRFVSISAPHRGSVLAHCWPGKGSRHMRPGSDFLRELNRDIAMLRKISFTSIWTPLDLMVLPARSSLLGVGREVRVMMPLHPLMVWHPRCLRLVEEALAQPV